MTKLPSFSVLQQKVKQIKADNNLKSMGIAFMRLALQAILKINDDELEESITDGSMDGEVDAVYVDSRTVHVFTFKYTDEFKNTSKNYPESELDQFILTLEHILSASLDKKTINEAVWDKYQEIVSLFEDGPVAFKTYVVSNLLKPVGHAQRKLENMLNEFRVDEPIYYDQEDLVSSLITSKIKKINGKLTFIEKKHLEKADGPIRTIIGVIAANDLIELIKDPQDSTKVNNDIFNENVRVYKKNHRVNKAIINSALSDNNYEFFYLNNGITILCEDAGYTPLKRSPVVPLSNVQIINGCQTSHSLFASYMEDAAKVGNVELLVRVCVAKRDAAISEMIKESSNSQIPVGSRDLHSNDPIQRTLQEEFDALDYYYERKPNQFLDKPKKKVINNELLGQIYMAYHLDMPSEAKNNKSLVFGEKYDEIFDETKISGAELLQLYKIYLPLLKMKKDIQVSSSSENPQVVSK